MTTLRMLCWSGYTEILASYAEELAHDGLHIEVYEDCGFRGMPISVPK